MADEKPAPGFTKVETEEVVLTAGTVAAMDLKPNDVLSIVASEGIDARSMAMVSESVSRGLESHGLNNLVLVFPHGTKVQKLTLSEKQIAELASRAPVRGEVVDPPDRIVRSAFGGFDRPST